MIKIMKSKCKMTLQKKFMMLLIWGALVSVFVSLFIHTRFCSGPDINQVGYSYLCEAKLTDIILFVSDLLFSCCWLGYHAQ